MRSGFVSIVGRPNVGKSSLVNSILNDNRTTVSEIAGTTRDTIDVEAERAVRRLVMVGLVPGLRHEPRATGTEAGRS